MYQIDDERILNAIVAAHGVCSAPGVYSTTDNYEGHASADAVYDYIQSKVNKPIILMDVAFHGPNIGSRLEVYKDRVEIAVRSDQEEAWKRFCAIKELVHLIIDKDEDCSPYGNDRIEDMLNVGIIGLASGNNPTGKPTQSELVAEVAAVEILYPAIQIRRDIEAMQTQDSEAKLNVLKTALIRQMPQYYAGTALRSDFRGFVAEAIKSCRDRSKD